MTTSHRDEPASVGRAYAALRHGGASQDRALAELALPPAAGRALEARFRARPPGRGADAMRPKFARHDRHLAAVRAAGGFPALSP